MEVPVGRAAYWIILPVVVGAVIGVAAILVRDTNGKVDIAVAVLGLVLGAQLELTRRLQKRSDRHDMAGRVIAQIEALPEDIAHTVRDNVALLATAAGSRQGDATYQQALKSRLNEQRAWLQHYNNGVIEVESDDVNWLIDWTAAARASIKATMMAHSDVRWWASNPGRRLWSANLEALHHGVTVERIFVYEKITSELRHLVGEHRNAGIHAYLVAANELRDELRIDVTLFDSRWVHEVIFSAGGNAMGYRYSKETGHVNLILAKFDRILRVATRVENFRFSD